MDITASLTTAFTLLGLGMAFVYAFLGLLFICIHLMAKYVPADKPSVNSKLKSPSKTVTKAQVNPHVIAAITSAVQQYRKAQAA